MTSVLQTTSESMLNPRAASVFDTLLKTPGSFWTRQLSTCRFGGASDGRGVSYKMLLTAAGADQAGGASEVGSGVIRR